MSAEIIQGDWDDLVDRIDLRGCKVRVVVLDEGRAEYPWLRNLRDWADSNGALGYSLDENRQGVFPG